MTNNEKEISSLICEGAEEHLSENSMRRERLRGTEGWIVLGSFNSLTTMVFFWSCLMLSDADKEPVDTNGEAKEEGGLEGEEWGIQLSRS
ncbi:uncharacterized [Tachysurus ichikawai]